MKKFVLIAVAVFALLAGVPAHAQAGCGDSPENPTAVLALVGSGGALIAAMRGRLRRK